MKWFKRWRLRQMERRLAVLRGQQFEGDKHGLCLPLLAGLIAGVRHDIARLKSRA